jgi:diketogulonate reductase-like aldo/keto reductase
MAYCPIDQGALAGDRRLAALAQPLGLSAAQLALAWTVRERGVIALPKAVQAAHLRANLQASRTPLDAATLAALDRLFAPPASPQPLAIT